MGEPPPKTMAGTTCGVYWPASTEAAKRFSVISLSCRYLHCHVACPNCPNGKFQRPAVTVVGTAQEEVSLMQTGERQIQSLDELRGYVHETLCEFDQLETGAFPMTERVLSRRGKRCGLHFCLHGPRSVRFSAIWEMEHNTVLFYSSSGERFQKIKLAAGALQLAAA